MRLWLDPQRMAARGITGADISAALLANNVQSAPGQVKSYFTVSNIIADTGLKDVEQFQNMVVKTAGDSIVRMRDVATVELDQQNVSQSGWIDDGKTVMMLINQRRPAIRWIPPRPCASAWTRSRPTCRRS
jgi:multidrug efflux pump